MSLIRVFTIGLVLLTFSVVDAAARSDPKKPAPTSSRATATSIQFAAELQRDVEELLQYSPTFRAQYQRIAGTPKIVVGVRVDVKLTQTLYRARTTFRRYSSGLIVADVRIGPGPHRGESIAHEFEHILEQLDGQDLKQMARNNAKDVWYSGDDVIETERAIKAGRTVRDELRQAQSTR